MGLFQRHHVLVAHPVGQEMSRVSAEREELGMCAAVRRTEQSQRMPDYLSQRFLVIVDKVEQRKFGLQILLDRNVEHEIDRMLALLFGNLGYGSALQMLVFIQVDIIDEGGLPFEHRQLACLAIFTAA